jgi:hypothetical protein
MTDEQFDVIAGLLIEIRDALAWLCAPPEADGDLDVQACGHEEAHRTDFSTPREIHWTCGDCGHEERRRTATHAPAVPGASAKE